MVANYNVAMFVFVVEIVCQETSLNSIRQEASVAELILIQLAHLIKLDLSSCNITNKGTDMIATVLLNTISLKQFNVANTNLNTTTAIKIISALKNINSLEILKMNNNDIDDAAVDAMVTVTHLIEELNISFNKFSLNGAIQMLQALSMTTNIKILDISGNFENYGSSDNIEELTTNLAKCFSLQELNISNNLLTFSNLLHITEQLKNHPNLHTLNMGSNIKSFILECEFLVDVILSTNQLLKDVNVCGRNIRLRFTDDCLFPPLNCNANSNRFILQNLYLTRCGFMNRFSQTTLNSTNTNCSEWICPTTGKSIISYYVDHNGGTFYHQEHDFAVVIPPGAVLQGDKIQVQATASHFGPYKLSKEYYPISSFFNISAYYAFKIPVYLIMGHYAKIRNLKDIDNLCLLHACDHDLTSERELVMKEVQSGVYFDYDISYCVFTTDHFCSSLCVGKKTQHIPGKFSALLYTYDTDEGYFADVCFCPASCDCKKVAMQLGSL